MPVEDFFVPLAKAADVPVEEPRAVVLHADGALGPGRAHARRTRRVARETYRPDLYRAALKPLGVPLPGANAKVEGALTAATPVGSAGASLVLGPDGSSTAGSSIPTRSTPTSPRRKRRPIGPDQSCSNLLHCTNLCCCAA